MFGGKSPDTDAGVEVMGGVLTSEANKVFLNESLISAPRVVLVGAQRSLETTAVVLATVLTTGRKAGWKGGSDFFHESDGASFLLAFRDGCTLTSDDAFDLSQKMRHSIVTIDEEGADLHFAFIDFFAEGGCVVRVVAR